MANLCVSVSIPTVFEAHIDFVCQRPAFPVKDFEDTLKKCETTLEPYADHLIDKKMTVRKFIYTIRYIGMEKEIDGLRKQITGHYQALHMCISFLQL
jgi:hypothetical protein